MTLNEHIEKIGNEFDEAVKAFGYKYSDDDTPDMYGVSKSFIDAEFKKLMVSFAREIAIATLADDIKTARNCHNGVSNSQVRAGIAKVVKTLSLKQDIKL